MKLYGVKHKVADCIALFSLDKPEAFPVDRHIREALMSRYFSSGPRPSDERLRECARDRFGKYAGLGGPTPLPVRLARSLTGVTGLSLTTAPPAPHGRILVASRGPGGRSGVAGEESPDSAGQGAG